MGALLKKTVHMRICSSFLTAGTIALVSRNDKKALFAFAHPKAALVPARDDATDAGLNHPQEKHEASKDCFH